MFFLSLNILRSTDISLKSGIEIQFPVSSQHVRLILFEVIFDSLFYFWQLRVD